MLAMHEPRRDQRLDARHAPSHVACEHEFSRQAIKQMAWSKPTVRETRRVHRAYFAVDECGLETHATVVLAHATGSTIVCVLAFK
jgi:hypothetical protein